MKKILATVMSAITLMSFAACTSNGSTSGNSKTESSSANTSATYKIGVCNYVDHASLNQIVDTLKTELTKKGEEKNVSFQIIEENCNADSDVMNQIISNFVAEKVDVMVGVATPVAMAMQAATEDNDIPVVFAAVSDPVAVKLVDSLEKPGKNITGTSDYLNTKSIMDLIFANNPDAKTVGLLYDIGQDASTGAIKEAKEYLDKKGVKYIEQTGTTAEEVALAAQSLADDKVDAVFTPTDNTIMESELSIYEIFTKAGIPHYAGADSFALNGAFLGYGVDYKLLGTDTAEMVCEITVDNKKPSEMAVRTFDNGIATINTETCQALGFDLETVKTAFKDHCTQIIETKTSASFES